MFLSKCATLAALLAISVASALAQAPAEVSFQGYLTSSTGEPKNGAYTMTFKLYRGGTNIWTESQGVTVHDGIFHVALGAVDPLDGIPFDEPLQLGIAVGKDPEMAPRTHLLSAAYARALPGLYTFYRQEGSNQGFNVIGGSADNVVEATVVGATIGGGGSITDPNTVAGNGATIGGGYGNVAVLHAVVGGGLGNLATEEGATVGGGGNNTADMDWSTIGGGSSNQTDGFDEYSTIGGGESNTATGGWSTIGGGNNNDVSGESGTIAGGTQNAANATSSTVGGGSFNTASGRFSVIPGGNFNEATRGYTFAAGRRAKADHSGTFVWADSTNLDFASTGVNQFLIRATGGVGIGTNDPSNNRLKVMNNLGSGTSSATIWAENTSTNNGIAGNFKTHGTDATVVVTNDGTGDLFRAFSSSGNLRFAVRNNGDVDHDGTLGTPASDLAEVFNVEGDTPHYEPGDVLVISTTTDKTVAKSDRPYSVRVAGVYATKPGVRLGTPEEGRTIPMGVVGVIPTKVSAENGPIQRGDLLVTSSTPGHAMKADPVVINGIEIYPSGTILGKALEPFDGPGRGMIEVLVNTQ